jgi:ABC-type multidrug transport system ATPase subunit
MVDTLVSPAVSRATAQAQTPYLSIKDVSVKSTQTHRSLNSISLELLPGEILGIAGVIGSGQDEIASILTGHLEPDSGSLVLAGKPADWKQLRHPRTSAAHVPADARKSTVGNLSAVHNSMLRDIHHKSFLRGPFLRSHLIRQTAIKRIEALDVRPKDPNAMCASLSGGNLQRLILARELDHPSKVLVAVNPAAGLDLSMAHRVRQELRIAADTGKAVVLISPNLQELLHTCDRVMVMCAGSVIGIECVENLDAESLGLLIGGVKLDIVQRLAKFLKSTEGQQIDATAKATLYELLKSKSAWQRRLAAQIALRVFDSEDLLTVQDCLSNETNAELKAWLQIIQAKLGGILPVKVMEFAFRANPSVFVEALRRILKCEDLKTLKATLANRLPSNALVWEDTLAQLVLNYFQHDRRASLPSATSSYVLTGLHNQAVARE